MKFSRQQYIGAVAILISILAAGAIVFTPASKPVVIKPSPSVAVSPSANPSPTASAVASAEPVAPGPVWADEFNGPASRAPDPSKWNHDLGGDGWGNAEWQYYTGSNQNAALDGAGHLVITAKRPEHPAGHCAEGPCDITSARLQTDGLLATQYGRIEARLQTPAGLGLWPAFWMVASDDTGEIDIMENNGREPGIISGSLHSYNYTPAHGLSTDFELPNLSASAGFHIYAVDWSASQIVWSVDGHSYQTIKKSDPAAAHWVFDRPYYLLLNLAVGSEDPGYPDGTTTFPARLVVDYVRVYR